MKRSKFSDEQVTFALRQHDAGTLVGDICRQLGVSEANFYVWKKQYARAVTPFPSADYVVATISGA